ncbi:YheC/YheD family protein [Solibacillus sp. FSL R7-0682]|uniref:YheC/YheD family protein n=1 Tax=Solibacillus sp. FSL R7-0682 TaxID=2921690 RepID=UPI0030F4D215
MQAIRGRVGQYKILAQHDSLRPYLAPQINYSKDTLFEMLERYDCLYLKPIVGMDIITINKIQEVFHITTTIHSFEATERETVYELIQKEVNNRRYLIQPQINEKFIPIRNYRRFITVQKRGLNWRVTASTKQSNHFQEYIIYSSQRASIQKIALLAAEQLGKYYSECEAIVVEVSFNRMGTFYITDSFLHFSVSKWNQYQSLEYLMPKTDLLTAATFQSFLQTYPLIFLKPCNGQQGKGIIKVQNVNSICYEIHMGRQKWVIQGIQPVYEHIRELAPIEDNYIIQQGIELATIKNYFTDIRVMTNKDQSDWQVTGKAVKVAGPHFFVTNAAQAVLPLELALKHSSIQPIHHPSLEKKIDKACLMAANLLDQPAERTIIGFDVGVTDYGQIWIIEGNYVPDMSLIYRFNDPLQYENILKINVNHST